MGKSCVILIQGIIFFAFQLVSSFCSNFFPFHPRISITRDIHTQMRHADSARRGGFLSPFDTLDSSATISTIYLSGSTTTGSEIVSKKTPLLHHLSTFPAASLANDFNSAIPYRFVLIVHIYNYCLFKRIKLAEGCGRESHRTHGKASLKTPCFPHWIINFSIDNFSYGSRFKINKFRSLCLCPQNTSS